MFPGRNISGQMIEQEVIFRQKNNSAEKLGGGRTGSQFDK